MRLRGWLPPALLVLLPVTLAGCSQTVDGSAQPAPGVTVTVPGAARQGAPGSTNPQPTSPRPTTPRSTTATPEAAVPIPPNGDGYTFVQTNSGKAQCQVSTSAVGCQVLFDQPGPVTADGLQANGVNVTAGGAVQYIQGNLGDPPYFTMDYATYTAQGWTIKATYDGTRFTNNATGHGMYVNISGVQSY
ncbi:hypothetical protein P0W64_07475 [Tsukamurella sp. 8F]|uniref:hypothetical protein n=1 Tax=unclassified Tsukamurella TaxID=2633480 RepID=UPI0023B9200D|nr:MULTISPECIES: hypothetical protein [unclassified Tsukamurella]MDF0528776.1 hypothetical protein [Tsukamurella sp. 8J]MDF0586611.1 hypothetical protein [Tsukamurella sp. 8F]